MNEKIKISQIKPNDKNPRFIKDDKFKKLVANIEKYPNFLEKRPIVIESYENPIILGGNMRFRALKELGYKEIPTNWVVTADSFTDDEKKAFIILDNVGFGEWDFDILANEWDVEELSDWGIITTFDNGHLINDELNEQNLDYDEEFDPIGESNGHQKIVFTFSSKEDAESWITSYSEFKDIVKRQGQAWQINLTTQSI